jgi:hypothetical protein
MASDVTDAGVVEGLLRAGGLCREHLLLGVAVAEAEADPVGMAMLAELLLGEAYKRLARRAGAVQARRRFGRRSSGGSTPPGSRCPACAAENVIVDGYLDLLVASPQRYLCGPLAGPERGLCLPHALQALGRPGSKSCSGAVVDAWASTARRLQSQLGELIRKRRYQYRHELPGPEAQAWRIAPYWLVGGPRRPSRRSPGTSQQGGAM